MTSYLKGKLINLVSFKPREESVSRKKKQLTLSNAIYKSNKMNRKNFRGLVQV